MSFVFKHQIVQVTVENSTNCEMTHMVENRKPLKYIKKTNEINRDIEKAVSKNKTWGLFSVEQRKKEETNKEKPDIE